MTSVPSSSILERGVRSSGSDTLACRRRLAAEPLARSRHGVRPRGSDTCAALVAIAFVLGATPALADLKLCNGTSSRVGVAIGYEEKSGWTTEGWWNIAAQSCETILRGAPPSRYLYVYAIDYDRGGEWTGTSFMCTGDKSFRIRDTKDCESRGHRRTGFMEVDTGGQRDWTVQFNDPE